MVLHEAYSAVEQVKGVMGPSVRGLILESRIWLARLLPSALAIKLPGIPHYLLELDEYNLKMEASSVYV